MAFNIKKTGKKIAGKLSLKKKTKATDHNDLATTLVAEPHKTTKKINTKSPLLMLGGLLGILVIFFVVMGVGIYQYSWEDSFTKAVSVFPYPAAKVNSSYIMYHDYLDRLDILKNYEKDFKKVDFNSAKGKDVLWADRKDTMNGLISASLISDEAKRLKITVSDKELNDQFNQLIKISGGSTKFTSILKENYNVTPEQFKQESFKPRILEQKLAIAYSKDETINADAKKKAEEVLAKIKAGGNFEELAKQYSQDTSASNGGNLDYFTKGKMVPEFEKAAFALKNGEVSGIVKTVYGYHIIKVTDIRGDEIKASHILIKTKDFNTWIDEAAKKANKTIYIKVSK
ncbi:MAG: peptidylprolyl isomerase [bacterium]